MTRSRPVVSSGLIAVGGILLFAGLIAFWGRVAIYDPHGFSSRAIEVLENDAVRTVVTENVVDEIVARGSAQLVAVRPVLELAVGQVVESRPFRAIYGNAVRQAHASLFAPDQAIVKSSWATHTFNPRRKTQHVFFGRCEHTLRLESGTWRIARKKALLLNYYIPAVLDFYMV